MEFLVGIVVGVTLSLGVLAVLARRQKVPPEHVLVRWGGERSQVFFSGGWVWPMVHRAEVMDLRVKTVEIDRRGKDGIICRDNIRADVKVSFFVRVGRTQEDVLKVAQTVGCARASEQATLEELFSAKFSEALKTVGKQLDFEELFTERERFRDQLLRVIGLDLNGFQLDDAAIDFLEQTPIAQLDPDNILDAEGIKKITERTARARIRALELEREAQAQIQAMELDVAHQQARMKREVAEVEARVELEVAQHRAQVELEVAQATLKAEQQMSEARIELERRLARARIEAERSEASLRTAVLVEAEVAKIEAAAKAELASVDAAAQAERAQRQGVSSTMAAEPTPGQEATAASAPAPGGWSGDPPDPWGDMDARMAQMEAERDAEIARLRAELDGGEG